MRFRLFSDRKLAGLVWRLVWPAAMSNAVFSGSRLVEVMLLGRLGTQGVAAMGAAFQVMVPMVIILGELSIGCRTFVAQAVGGGRHREAEEAVAQSILLATLGGLFCMLLGFTLGPRLLRLVVGEVEPEFLAEAMRFMRILPLAFIPWLLHDAIQAVLSGAGDTLRPLALNIVMWGVVLGWDYLVLAGPLAHLSLGAAGVAMGRSWSRLIAVFLGLALLFSGRLVLRAPRRPAAYLPNLGLLRRILRVSLPSCGSHALWSLTDLGFYSILARATTSPAEKSVNLAAYSIGSRVAGLLFEPLWGFSTASSTLVGQSQGAGRPEEAARRGWATGAHGLVVGVVLGLILLALARPTAAFFNRTGQPAVTKVAASFLIVWALIGTVEGLIAALEGGLMGAGDTRCLLLFELLDDLVVHLGLSALFVFVLGWGVKGAFWGLGLTSLVWLGLVGARFASGQWKRIRV